MPRILESSQRNELRLIDNRSNSDIVLYYRDPTTAEMAAYTNESLRRRRNKLELRQTEARLKFGAKVLTGFRPGDFCKRVAGKVVPVASDAQHPDFDPKWKELVEQHAADLLILLASHVFEAPAEVAEAEDPDADAEDAKADEDVEGN